MKVKTLALFLIVLSLAFPSIAQEKEKTSTETESVSLPNSPNSWIINIHQRGGIIGIHKLLVALNSDGKYVCGENGKTKSILQTDQNFLDLAKLIKPIENDIFFKTINEEFAYCNDCLYSTLSFCQQKEKVKDGEIVEASSKKTVEPTAKEISEKVWKTVKCD